MSGCGCLDVIILKCVAREKWMGSSWRMVKICRGLFFFVFRSLLKCLQSFLDIAARSWQNHKKIFDIHKSVEKNENGLYDRKERDRKLWFLCKNSYKS